MAEHRNTAQATFGCCPIGWEDTSAPSLRSTRNLSEGTVSRCASLSQDDRIDYNEVTVPEH